MIECIFTIDYEIYGNGEGSLRELVYEPVARLMAIFENWNVRFVTFAEIAELEMMETYCTDQTISLVKKQLQELYRKGFELGLHLHPQWYNAQYVCGRWNLDYSEYNLCSLSHKRITQIITRSLAYFRHVLGEHEFTPLSFRAGNWLFQPTKTVARVLAENGIKIDSSVFKGGLQHQHGLDYRHALRNVYYWMFADYIVSPDPNGILLELPIYTQMVPFWKMFTRKRLGLQQKVSSSIKTSNKRLHRLPDLLRFSYPLKFDYCRMTLDELTHMVDKIILDDQKDPALFRPIVAIGHTKDLVDFETVESFLKYLGRKDIPISTFKEVYHKCKF